MGLSLIGRGTMNHLKTKVGQYAVIIKDKKILQLYPPNGPLWVFPGGRLNENDDDYEKALKREVKEELGIDIEVLDPLDIQMWSINGTDHRYGVFFECKHNEKHEIKLSKEHTQFKWFSYEELIKHYNEFPERAAPGIKLAITLHKKGYF